MVFFNMPSHSKEKGWDFDGPNGVSGKLYHIKVPFPINVHIRPEGKNVDQVTQVITIPRLYTDKNIVISEAKKNGIEIVQVDQQSFGPLVDLCPKCKRRGIPSIQKKNTDQIKVKVNIEYTIDLKGKIVKTSKEPTFWLRYSHKQKDDGPKYCWVRQWQGSGNGTFKESKKGQFIDPRDFLIGQQMRNLVTLK